MHQHQHTHVPTHLCTVSFRVIWFHFNRIWDIHVAMYYFFTSYNSQNIYKQSNTNNVTPVMIWSATALGGAVATLIKLGTTISVSVAGRRR